MVLILLLIIMIIMMMVTHSQAALSGHEYRGLRLSEVRRYQTLKKHKNYHDCNLIKNALNHIWESALTLQTRLCYFSSWQC